MGGMILTKVNVYIFTFRLIDKSGGQQLTWRCYEQDLSIVFFICNLIYTSRVGLQNKATTTIAIYDRDS